MLSRFSAKASVPTPDGSFPMEPHVSLSHDFENQAEQPAIGMSVILLQSHMLEYIQETSKAFAQGCWCCG